MQLDPANPADYSNDQPFTVGKPVDPNDEDPTGEIPKPIDETSVLTEPVAPKGVPEADEDDLSDQELDDLEDGMEDGEDA